MARGRHAKRSGLLTRLFPGRAAHRRAELARQREVVRAHFDEVHRLRTVGTALAAQAAQASVRAVRAEQAAAAVRAELGDLRSDTAVLREELTRLREEMIWAWAEGQLPGAHAAPEPQSASQQAPARVIDLRTG